MDRIILLDIVLLLPVCYRQHFMLLYRLALLNRLSLSHY